MDDTNFIKLVCTVNEFEHMKLRINWHEPIPPI